MKWKKSFRCGNMTGKYAILWYTLSKLRSRRKGGTKTYTQLGQYANLAPGEGNQFQCSEKLRDVLINYVVLFSQTSGPVWKLIYRRRSIIKKG